jgi:hypothetical protein
MLYARGSFSRPPSWVSPGSNGPPLRALGWIGISRFTCFDVRLRRSLDSAKKVHTWLPFRALPSLHRSFAGTSGCAIMVGLG